jgi:hypothetical protein
MYYVLGWGAAAAIIKLDGNIAGVLYVRLMIRHSSPLISVKYVLVRFAIALQSMQ